MSGKPQRPRYRVDAAGYAKTDLNGEVIRLGRAGTTNSRQRFKDVVRQWEQSQTNDGKCHRSAVDHLVTEFLDHAGAYYRHPDGTPTGQIENKVRPALTPLVRLFGNLPILEFSPKKLKQVRQSMIDAGLARTTINARIACIRQMFKWGVEEELVSVEIHQARCSTRD